ncbi:MAG: sugar transferase [Flavobacteriaceae bacterium]|nr:sugar transferase [Flavobacteriaceae bacterium]
MYKKGFKRLIDLTISFLSLLFLSPLLLLVAFLIKVTSKGPVFYTQERLGYQGKTFKLYKFRSMKVNNTVSEKTQVFKGNTSVTGIGQIIRRFKIDELAQLINIFNGDMSIVGPRPCLPSLKEEFNETAYYRLKAKPGLTGLAQINGNIFLSWEERWEFDKQYVENITFVKDLGIILKTILIVFLGEEKFKK